MDTNMGRDFDVPDIEDDQIEEATGDLDVPDIVDSVDDFAQPGTDDLPVIEEDDGDEVVLSRDNDFEFDDTYVGGLQSEDEMDAGEFQEYDTDQDGITLPQDVVLEEENSGDSVREDQSEPQDEYQEADGEDGSSTVPEEEDVSADDEINLQDEVDLQDEIQQQDEIDLQDESLQQNETMQQNETLHDDKDIIGELYEDDVRHHGDIGLSGLDGVELPDIVLDDDALDEGVLDADIMLEESVPVEDEAAELNAEDIFKELELDSLEVLGGEADTETTQAPSASGTAPDPPGEGAGASTTAAADDDGMSTQKKSGDEADIIAKAEVISTYGDIHSRIAASDKKKYVKRLFGKNADAMENAIDTLNGKSTWREASEYIDELFIKHEVDMYSRVAMKFSDDIYKRYLNKKS